jgi:hypothetical protein
MGGFFMSGLMFAAFIRRLFHADFIESGRFSLSMPAKNKTNRGLTTYF